MIGNQPTTRADGRVATQLRPVSFTLGVQKWAEGSCLVKFGDLLMVLVNVGRKLGIEAEAALRAGNDKFRRRFATVERLAAERAVALRDLSFEELDELWDAAKAEEKETAR